MTMIGATARSMRLASSWRRFQSPCAWSLLIIRIEFASR